LKGRKSVCICRVFAFAGLKIRSRKNAWPIERIIDSEYLFPPGIPMSALADFEEKECVMLWYITMGENLPLKFITKDNVLHVLTGE
jgi:hypothetical protein